METLDIKSKAPYPGNDLSNFAPHEFEIDGVKCASMEGFLQSLKFRNSKKQLQICGLTGKEAKAAPGFLRNRLWKLTGILYWKGVPVKRCSDQYQLLLDKAFAALSQNAIFREAITATGNARLTHTIGKQNAKQTILTEYEFINRLMAIRTSLRNSCG